MATLERLQTHHFMSRLDHNTRPVLPAETRREAPCFDTSQSASTKPDADVSWADARFGILQGACESNVAC
jgi:hypothetical protein